MAQKKYALVVNHLIRSTFYSDKPKSAFPDIAHLLVEVSEDVCCNDYWVGGKCIKRPDPIEVVDARGAVGIIEPSLSVTVNQMNGVAVIIGIALGVGAGVISYFF